MTRSNRTTLALTLAVVAVASLAFSATPVHAAPLVLPDPSTPLTAPSPLQHASCGARLVAQISDLSGLSCAQHAPNPSQRVSSSVRA